MSVLISIKQKLSRSPVFNLFLRWLPGYCLTLKPLKHVMIEPTNICNLQCLFCSQASSSRPKGMMSLADFNKILSLLPRSVKEVQLHFAGESLLNPDLPAMIRELKKHGLKTILSTNGNAASEMYQKIIGAGLDELIFLLTALLGQPMKNTGRAAILKKWSVIFRR